MAKRLLCVLLSVLMVVAMLPAGAVAETTASVTYSYTDSALQVSARYNTSVSETTITFNGTQWAQAYVKFSSSIDLSLYDTVTYTVSNVTGTAFQVILTDADGSAEYPSSFTEAGIYSFTLSNGMQYFELQDTAGGSEVSLTLDSVTLSDSTGSNANVVCTYSETDLSVSKNWGCDVSGNTVTFTGSQWAEAYVNFAEAVNFSLYNTLTFTVSDVSGSAQLKLYYADGSEGYASFSESGTYTKTLAGTLNYFVIQNPGTDVITVSLDSVTLSNVVEDTPIYQFTSYYGSGEDSSTYTCSLVYADYLTEWDADDTIVITAVLKSTNNFTGALGANNGDGESVWTQESFTSDDGSEVTVTLSVTAGSNSGSQIQIYWLNGSYVNLTSVTMEVESSSTTPTLYGKTLTLDGSIGVTYYFDMGELDASDYTLKGTLSYGGNSTDVAVSASEYTVTIGSTEYTSYTVPVTIATFLGTIDVDLVDSNSDVVVSLDDYSASDYCTNMADNTNVGDLCKALVTYAYYADVAVNGNGGSLITGYENMSSYTGASSLTASASDGVTKTLVLGDTIYIRVYVDDASATYTVSGKTLTSGSDTTGSYIEFPVAAKQMATEFTVLKDGSDYTTYSVNDYVANQLSSSSTATNAVKNLCKAVYYYGQAASAYSSWI